MHWYFPFQWDRLCRQPSKGAKERYYLSSPDGRPVRESMLKLILACTLISIHTASNAHDPLSGAYERVSLTNVRTGKSPEAAERQGLLIMAHGHYSMMTMNPSRRVLDNDEVALLNNEQELEYLKEWLDINGHTGRYDASDTTLTWYRDISENPKEVGTESQLGYEWRDRLLVIYFTLPNGDRYDWVWRKLD